MLKNAYTIHVKLSMSAEYFARINCDEGLGSPATSMVLDPSQQIRPGQLVGKLREGDGELTP